MRRLLRWTFHALAATSWLLCMAVATLWVRSYWVGDLFLATHPSTLKVRGDDDVPRYACVVMSEDGRIGGWYGWSVQPEDQRTPPWQFELSHQPGGFTNDPRSTPYSSLPRGHAFYSRSWRVPDWPLVAGFAALPAVVVLRQLRAVRRRRRRARLGCCPACGYDLRATPERCPECGSVSGKAIA